MLSSFIALAAGMIGATPATPPAPVAETVVVQVRPAETIAAPIEAEVQKAEPDVVVPVQGTVPSPDSPPATDTQTAPTESMTLSPPVPKDTTPSVETAPVPVQSPQALRGDPTIVSPTERRAILKAAANGLARVETARGRFIQFDVNGQLSEGSFALQRPGRMRFDYDDPVPYLMAADGTTVAWRDEELEQVDRAPLSSTPLKLLLNNAIDFDTDAEVLRVQKDRGMVAITLRDRSGESDDQLTLLFESASYALSGWRVLDANGGITQVQLRNIETGIQLSPRLFIVEDFEDEDDDRRR